jgi:chorismate dehydratase
MLHGPQRNQVQLSFSLPSACAAEIEAGSFDVGLLPVAEIARQRLELVPGVGITCIGPVRSILLFSKVPWANIRTLAGDASSRTSVRLAQVILRERFGISPAMVSEPPSLTEMLDKADAALIIGDPALCLDPEQQPYLWMDLGAEWFNLTGLPMVFAAWAHRPGLRSGTIAELTNGSYEFGKAHLSEIVDEEFSKRKVTRGLADRYLRQHIRFELGDRELRGLDTFVKLAGLPELQGLTPRP